MSRFCILTNTKEFKNTQSKFNIGKFSLEKILYDYYNNVANSDDVFPSDEYIQLKLNPTVTTNNKKILEFVKQNGYDSPIITNDTNKFKQELDKVKKFFTDDLFVTYTDADGNSVIKVADFIYDENSLLEFVNQNEIEEIKRKAIADGTFMKAPNGKPTKLNEKQWLQVRTKAFKEWFGDWERAAKNGKLTIADFVRSLDKTLLKNTTFPESKITNSVFHISKNKINKFSKNYTNTNAPDTELGYFFTEDLNTITDLREVKHHQGVKDVLGHNVHIVDINLKNPLYVDSYMSTLPVELGYVTKDELSKLTSQEKHNLYKQIKEDLENKGYDGVAYVLGYETDEDGIPQRSIGYVVFDNNNIKVKDVKNDTDFTDFDANTDVSKVVDENGEPLVVYHNSENQFSSFSYEHVSDPESGFFFSSDENYASQFGTEKYPVFLNVRNPIRTDIPLHRENLISIYRNEWKEGTDGVIGKDKVEEGLNPSNGNEWMVFKPNQVKSATDNTGTFSRTDSNIYNEDISFETPNSLGKVDTRLQELFARNRLSVSNNKKVTVKDLLSIVENSKYSSIVSLLNTLDKTKELDDVKVELVNKSSEKFNRKRAYYNASERTIYINVNALYENGDSSSVLLHEVLHPLTIDRIQQNAKLRKEILSIIDEYQEVYFDTRYYAKLDDVNEQHHAVEEFIADVWSNPLTINNLKSIKTKNNKNKTLWDKFKQFFQDLFSGIFLGATDDSLFAKASSSIIELLETLANNVATDNYYEYNQSNSTINNPFVLNNNGINTETDKNYYGSYTISVNPEYFNSVENRDEIDSDEALQEFLNNTLSQVPYGAIIRINTGDNKLDARIQLIFRKNDLLHYVSTDRRRIDIDQETKEGANFITYLKSIGAISKDTATLTTGSAKAYYIHGYTYVKTPQAIRESKQMKNLNDNVSGKRLRSLAIGAVYKISELVTQIQSGDPIVEKLFNSAALEEIKALKGKDRITIIKEITIPGLASVIKEQYFNFKAPEEIKNKSLSGLNRRKRQEIKAIYENFESFINFGYVKLEALEGISINNNPHMEEKFIELFDGEDEQTIIETYGSSLEHWQVGFRSVSAVTNLSKLIKLALENMYEFDETYTKQSDEYGLEKRINSSLAVANMLSWFIGKQSVEDMVKVLQEKMEKYPWLAQLVNDDPDLRDSNGELVGLGKLITTDKNGMIHGENEQFRSKFFNNMYLYFQKYGVVKSDGTIAIVNDKSDIKGIIDEILTIAKTNNSFIENGVPVKRESGNIVDTIVNTIDKIGKALQIKGETVIDDSLVRQIKELFNALGINQFNEELIKAVLTVAPKHLIQIRNSISPQSGIAYQFLSYNSKSKQIDDEFWKQYRNDVTKIVKPFSDFVVNRTEAVTYQDGKLYYSYVLPSYMSKFNTKIKNGGDFIEKEFKSEFFGLTDKEGKKQYLNEWLRRLASEKSAREDFEHKVVLADNGVSYTKKTPKQYMNTILTEYLYHSHKRLAWYKVPMMSNKPSEEYIRFYRYTEGFKSLITDFLVNTTMQEILRIADVVNRARRIEAGDLSADEKTKFYDINVSKVEKESDRHTDEELIKLGIEQGAGTRFMMMSFLQPYLEKALNNKNDTGLGRKLLDLILGFNENREAESDAELFFGGEGEIGENTLLNSLKVIIAKEMNNNFQDFLNVLKAEGVIEVDPKTGRYSTDIKKLGSTNEEIENTLEEYFWNDFYASLSMMLLYITDPIYYGTAEELQKRLALLHAPGSRMNVTARDSNGELYSANENGRHIYRLIKLRDDEITSDTISNVNSVFDDLIQKNRNNEPLVAYYKTQRDFIVSKLSKVNVTDAQTFCTPTAMRKKLGMLGDWNDAREKAYQNLAKGIVHKSDLSVLMQPLKPFMFSLKQVTDPDGLFKTRRVGVQVKTSEYLLILADAICRGANKDTKLSAIFDVIEESLAVEDPVTKQKIPTGKGVDAISFESAIKTGLGAVIDLNNLNNDDVRTTLRKAIYAGSNGYNTTSQYNSTFVDELDYEDYSIQQLVPTHFFGKQQLGSLSKALMFADMEEYERDENGKYKVDENGKRIDRYIYVKDKDGNRVKTSVAEAKQKYFKLLAESIDMAKDKLLKELNLNHASQGIQNVAISELLKKQILEDARFGSDLLWAVDTNEKGEFNLPLSDPTHSIRIQLLLYAIIKDRIYKQLIHGGPVVQVSNWGTEDLHIRYTNKNGETLLTEDEFNQLKAAAKKSDSEKDDKKKRTERASILNKLSRHASVTVQENGKTISLNTYEQYKKYHMVDGGVVYECYAPIYDDALLKYEDPKTGEIDIEQIRREEPLLLELIGYRIPTEAKYSMASLRIVGFLPREAGEGIMLPKEWTAISGSDFDVDKLYIMRRSFTLVGNEKQGLRWKKGITKQDQINDEIFDIMQGILESNQALSKVVKIGTFDPLKLVGYKLAALREAKAELALENGLIDAENSVRTEFEGQLEHKKLDKTYDTLSNNIKELKNQAIKNKNLAFAHVHLQFFKQNMVAAKLIGVFAQSNISHAYLSMYASSIGSERGVRVDDLGFSKFSLFGNVIDSNDFYIDSIYGFDGTPVSDNLAAFLAASVDAVKDPILNLMNINMKTVNAVVAMARMGFNIEQIGLLFGQEIVTKLVQRMDKYGEDFETAIKKESDNLKKVLDKDEELRGVNFDLNLTTKELKDNLVESSLLIDYTILETLKQINKIANAARSIVHMTRFNSISSAKGPNIVNAIDEDFKTNKYYETIGQYNDQLNQAVLNPVLKATTDAVNEIERRLIGNRFVLSKPHFVSTYAKYLAITNQDINIIDEKDAKKFSDFYMDYMLNKVARIFDLSHDHRLEVISTYPEQILAMKSDPRFVDNKFIQSILQRQDSKDQFVGIDIELLNANSDDIEDIKTDFNEFADEEPEMTKKIIEYMFNRGGFSFNPKTFTNLITSYIKDKLMPEYLDNLRSLESNNGYFDSVDDLDLEQLSDNIIHQYLLHFGNKKFNRAEIKTFNDLELFGKKTDDLKLGNSFEIHNKHINNYGIYLLTLPSSNSNNNVLITARVDSISKSGIAEVTVVETLGGNGQGLEIDPSKDVVKSIYDKKKKDERPPEVPKQPIGSDSRSDEYYESMDNSIAEETERESVQQNVSEFERVKSNPLAGNNSYLALLMNEDSEQPVTQAIQDEDINDINDTVQSAINIVNNTTEQLQSTIEQQDYVDSLTLMMVNDGTITQQLANTGILTDKDSNNCN